jgi:hypothetical protein
MGDSSDEQIGVSQGSEGYEADAIREGRGEGRSEGGSQTGLADARWACEGEQASLTRA